MTKKPKAQNRLAAHQPREDFMTILAEMDASDHRSAAIVAAAFVENNLALAIMARLRRLDAAEQEHLFENRGTISDFASKIDLGFALNIYGPLVRDDLDCIRQIRNRFAHYLDIRDFDHPNVSTFCDALNGRRYLDDLARPRQPELPTRREVFLIVASHFGARFDLESKSTHTPPGGAALVAPDY